MKPQTIFFVVIQMVSNSLGHLEELFSRLLSRLVGFDPRLLLDFLLQDIILVYAGTTARQQDFHLNLESARAGSEASLLK